VLWTVTIYYGSSSGFFDVFSKLFYKEKVHKFQQIYGKM
jgi:hypothetical protein